MKICALVKVFFLFCGGVHFLGGGGVEMLVDTAFKELYYLFFSFSVRGTCFL